MMKRETSIQTFRPSYIFTLQGSNRLGANKNKEIKIEEEIEAEVEEE